MKRTITDSLMKRNHNGLYGWLITYLMFLYFQLHFPQSHLSCSLQQKCSLISAEACITMLISALTRICTLITTVILHWLTDYSGITECSAQLTIPSSHPPLSCVCLSSKILTTVCLYDVTWTGWTQNYFVSPRQQFIAIFMHKSWLLHVYIWCNICN